MADQTHIPAVHEVRIDVLIASYQSEVSNLTQRLVERDALCRMLESDNAQLRAKIEELQEQLEGEEEDTDDKSE